VCCPSFPLLSPLPFLLPAPPSTAPHLTHATRYSQPPSASTSNVCVVFLLCFPFISFPRRTTKQQRKQRVACISEVVQRVSVRFCTRILRFLLVAFLALSAIHTWVFLCLSLSMRMHMRVRAVPESARSMEGGTLALLCFTHDTEGCSPPPPLV
jgi:hypothetical protein